ncbi:heterodisulfide reductase-related iron-sulfur binding cluster [Spongisporangium articulatum]|uniref:Heterodisulfide reductase-related iron-sulfur binding cluster n=1 Tax=Spongisporangium articulatum TaxID=3362603 RepID=A0ABW8AHM2_9ACTN
MQAVRITIGMAMVLVAFAVAGRRVGWLVQLIRSGQPEPGRLENLGKLIRTQTAEVVGQKKLLQWSVPGLAHAFTFWGFSVLFLCIIEAFGAIFDEDFAIPVIGHWAVVGFIEDFFTTAVLLALITFAIIRVVKAPDRLHRGSRFFGSHTGPAWVILGMISLVMITQTLFRAASVNTGVFPYNKAAFLSHLTAWPLDQLSEHTNEVLETVFLLSNVGIILGFLVLVVHSKHLHIGLAPINVSAKREPKALGALLPIQIKGEPLDFEKVDELDEDAALGVGKVEDFTWKGLLDFATCTECGRCQSQCPAWNTEKPLSPKLLIMGLRDHLFAKGPWLLADEALREKAEKGEKTGIPASAVAAAQTPLVGDTGYASHGGPDDPHGDVLGSLAAYNAEGGAIDPDVLWSCVTCGACVEQCPVDIEHVDHIVDMRRYQVLIESAFPNELNGLFKNLEKNSNPWGMSPRLRMDWAKDLPFEVKQVGTDIEDLSEVEYLFWVGCAGAYEDRQKKTTRAIAELLNTAGVSFAVLGDGEACTGDSARRSGNEFLFQQLAMQNVEVLNEAGAKKIVVSCAHCFNTLSKEYPQVGGNYEVVHHTQLLNRLVRDKKLIPVAPVSGSADSTAGKLTTEPVTYHDPCYIGRHNGIYEPPRELIGALPYVEFKEMPRNQSRSFCCGAGGARMWMEETIGKRINNTRAQEAIDTGADKIAVGCPFCNVMLSDGLTNSQSEGNARQEVEVLDVAQLLLAAVKRG